MKPITLSGLPMGEPQQNKKKTGFFMKIIEMNKEGKPLGVYTVFSSALSDFKPDENGIVTLEVNVPEFLFVLND